MVVMTGTAISVLLASQTDLNLAGVTREQQMALYAAEYAVARAKSLIASQTVPMYNSATGWNGLLTAPFQVLQDALCDPNAGVAVPGAAPGRTPKAVHPTQIFYTLPDKSGNASPTGQGLDVTWNFCIHNNADDPGYLDPLGLPDGNTNDARDPQHLIVIEAFGAAPNGAQVQLSVTVGQPTLNTTGGTSSYAQEGAGGVHTGEGGSSEAGIVVTGGTPVKF